MSVQACLRTLSASAPWSTEALDALGDGCRVKAAAFKGWAALLARRFGPEAVAEVRERAGLGPEVLPDAPASSGDFPVAFQLRLTRATVDAFGGGDLTSLEDLLLDDAVSGIDKVKRRLLRLTVSPAAVLRGADRIYAALYSPGRAQADVQRRVATVRWEGAPFLAEPTWRALQVTALGGLFRTLGGVEPELSLLPEREAGPSFGLTLRW